MPSAKIRLTELKVQSLKPIPGKVSARRDGRHFVMDTDVGGFGVKVTEAGGRSYVLITRYPGFKHPAPRELGKCGVLSLEEAREKARAWKRLVAQGVDPAEIDRANALAATRRRETVVAAVAEDFIREKLSGERQGRDVERDLRKEFLAPWGKRPIAEITDEDVLQVIREAKARGAASHARNLLGYVRRFFDWAIEQRVYGIKTNPCAGMKPAKLLGEKRSRERVLTDDEIFAFWRATRRLGYPFGPIYQLLLLSGLRLNEVADARWPEFNRPEKVWTVPADRMKGKDGRAREHVVPITSDISAILNSLPTFKSGQYLFSATFGAKPVWMSNKVKRRLDRRLLATLRALARVRGNAPSVAELRPWVNHDLRRTLRTGLSRLRIDRDVREAVLAHTRPGVEGTYDRYDYLDEKRDALERWARRLHEIVTLVPKVRS